MVPIYEGDKSYVFISYSHKDTALVTEIMEELSANGVRIWYDAGIEAGSEWPENIGNHLSACGCVLCFISANYAASDNCRRELTFALSLKKPTVSIYLERCQLSAGLQLQLGLAQSLFCDQFSASKALADNIAMLSVLESCCVFDGDAGGDYTGTILKGQKQGQGTFTYTSGHVYSGDWVDNQRCGFGILSRNGQEIYKGMWKDDKYHGQGIYYHQDGTVYDGQWEDGLRCGQGKFTYADGAVYEGQWKNGQRHGDGTYIYADEGENKRRYVGQWREDRMEGKGLFTFRDGSTYEGDFENWKFHGYGVRKYADGRIYAGQWEKNNYSGQGLFTYADGKCWEGLFRDDNMWTGQGFLYYFKSGELTGKTYEGQLLEGKYHGNGTCHYENGAIYDGQWENGNRHGQGSYLYADEGENKRRYVGQWSEDRMEGKGVFTFRDGSTYEGDFIDWRFEGFGVRKYLGGAVYEGQWKNSKRHDQGTYVYADEGERKRRYVGQWREDRMEGKGIFTYQDGSTYEGDFVNWEFQGYGIRKFSDGRCYDGYWESNKQNGHGVFTYADGKRWEGLFQNDKMWTGQGFLYYFKGGELTGKTYDGQLVEGKYRGSGTCHYENGAVYDGEWENGKRHGQGTYIYADEGENKRRYVGQWREDRMEGKGTFTFRDGSTYEGDFVDWKYEGYGIRRYANGCSYAGEWQNDRQNGQGVYTYEDGKCWEGLFRDDKMWTGRGFLRYYENGKLTGKTYNGQLLESQYHGEGTCVYEDGTVYDGQWENHQFHGQGSCEWTTTSDAMGPLVRARKEGTWIRNHMIEGSVEVYRRQMDGTFSLLSYEEGKLDYKGDFIGVVKVRGKRRTKTRLRIPGYPFRWPNWWILRITMEKAIWQFEGKDSQLPEGYGTAVCYDETIVEGHFLGGKLDETVACTVTYPNGAVYTGFTHNLNRHGQGILRDVDDAYYDGIWENDCFAEGRTERMAFGNGRYTGQLKNGTPHGEGTLVKPDGSSQSGIWKKGKLIQRT